MTFLGLIKDIIVEETNDKPIKQKLLDLIGHLGPVKAAKYVGGIKNLVDIAYDGDIKKFSDETNTKIRISNDGMNMYFPDTLVQLLGFEDIDGSGKEKELGNFIYKKEGMKFRFNGRLMKTSFSEALEQALASTHMLGNGWVQRVGPCESKMLADDGQWLPFMESHHYRVK